VNNQKLIRKDIWERNGKFNNSDWSFYYLVKKMSKNTPGMKVYIQNNNIVIEYWE